MSAKVCFIVLCVKYTQDIHNVNAVHMLCLLVTIIVLWNNIAIDHL